MSGLFSKHNFQIADFCAKGSSRPELSGILVEPNRTSATDSFTLISVSTPTGLKTEDYPIFPNKPKPKANFKPFILPQEEAKKLIKPLSRKVSLPILENAVVLQSNGEIAEIGTTDLQSFDGVFCRVIQEGYPKFNNILIEKGSYTEILVNPDYLRKMADFFSKFLDGKKELKMKIPKDTINPIRFYGIKENQEATGLIMPIKSS